MQGQDNLRIVSGYQTIYIVLTVGCHAFDVPPVIPHTLTCSQMSYIYQCHTVAPCPMSCVLQLNYIEGEIVISSLGLWTQSLSVSWLVYGLCALNIFVLAGKQSFSIFVSELYFTFL
jgi:hypothetical protein